MFVCVFLFDLEAFHSFKPTGCDALRRVASRNVENDARATLVKRWGKLKSQINRHTQTQISSHIGHFRDGGINPHIHAVVLDVVHQRLGRKLPKVGVHALRVRRHYQIATRPVYSARMVCPAQFKHKYFRF